MKKLLLLSLLTVFIGSLNARSLTKADVEACFSEANIGYGTYGTFLASLPANPDINIVKSWAQNDENVWPQSKQEAFVKCLETKI